MKILRKLMTKQVGKSNKKKTQQSSQKWWQEAPKWGSKSHPETLKRVPKARHGSRGGPGPQKVRKMTPKVVQDGTKNSTKERRYM